MRLYQLGLRHGRRLWVVVETDVRRHGQAEQLQVAQLPATALMNIQGGRYGRQYECEGTRTKFSFSKSTRQELMAPAAARPGCHPVWNSGNCLARGNDR
jgi:hypothetical protein